MASESRRLTEGDVKGKLITFEGPEGSGKSTQMEMLHAHLVRKGYDCLSTREPGGTPIGERIREIVLDVRQGNLADRAELFLILADRAQHTAEVILPALREGKIVLCDRYNDSTMAYQGYGRGLDLAETRRMCAYSSLGLQPDLTFLLDVDVDTGLNRSRERRKTGHPGKAVDRMEAAGKDFHERVRAGYLALAAEDAERIRILHSSQNVEEVHIEIVRIVEAALTVE
jgi:dTMP kinase